MIILQAAGWLILVLIALSVLGLAAQKVGRALCRQAEKIGAPAPRLLSTIASGAGLALLWLLTFALLTVVHAILNPG